MATRTEAYGLTKPEQNDYYDIDVLNENFDTIDAELKKAETERGAVRTIAKGGTGAATAEAALQNLGAAKAKELKGHIEGADNPHGVTAKQVGAVAKTGDTMTGNLNMKKTTPEIVMRHGDDGRFINIFIGSENIAYFRNAKDSGNRTGLMLCSENVEDIKNLLILQKINEGGVKYYSVFGEHNKPTGSYTGNGSTSKRVIDLGITIGSAEVVLIHSTQGSVIVTRASGLGLNGSNVVSIPYDKAHVEKESNGLVLNANDYILNKNGETYYYRVL